MSRVVTTLLDVLGLLLLATGATFAVDHWLHVGLGVSCAAGGLVVLAGSWVAARQSDGGGGQ